MAEFDRVAKNALFLILGNNASKVLSFFILIMLARYLGVSDYGAFTFAASFTAIFIIITDFGMKNYLQREISRNKKKVNFYIGIGLLNKIALSILSLVIIMIASNLLGYSESTRNHIYLFMIALVLESLSDTFGIAYKAFEKMYYSAVILTVRVVIRFILLLFAISLGMSLAHILQLFIIASVCALIVSYWLYNKHITRLVVSFDRISAKNIFMRSLPFGAAGLLMTLYTKIDIVMLSKMVTQNTDMIIGFYSSAYTLISSMEFIPIALSGAVSPIAARAFINSLPKLRSIFRTWQFYFSLISFPLVVGTILLAGPIVDVVFGSEYAGSVPALVILSVSWLFYFQMYSIGLALNSMNKERITLMATVITLLMNVVANMILIPRYSYLGAAIATVLSEATYMIIGFYFVHKHLVSVFDFKGLFRILLSTVVMGVIVFFFPLINVFLSMFIGILTYIICLLVFNVVPVHDRKRVLGFVGLK